jgi:hypothetical protein
MATNGVFDYVMKGVKRCELHSQVPQKTGWVLAELRHQVVVFSMLVPTTIDGMHPITALCCGLVIQQQEHGLDSTKNRSVEMG